MGKFQYHGGNRSAADIKRKASEGTRDYDSCWKSGIPVFRPRDGENCVRILPSPLKEEPDWDYKIFSHYDVGPDTTRYLCANKMLGKPCAVCDARNETSDADERDALRPVVGAICWVIDRDDEKAGPQLWSIPFTKVRNEILHRAVDKRSGQPILIDDPKEGYDVVFNRVGTSKKTDYTAVEIMRDPTPLHDKQETQERWLDYISDNPLPEILHFYDYDYIQKVLNGTSDRRSRDDEGAGESGEETTSLRSSRRSQAREQDEEQPSRRSRREDPEPESRFSRRRFAEADEEQQEERPSRRSFRDPEPEPETRSRRRQLLDEEPEQDARPARGRRMEADDDTPFDESGVDAADDAAGEAEEQPSAVRTARRQLERLKPTGRR